MCLPRPVTKTNCSMPASRASSTAYWITGLSTTGSISFGTALVAGRKRVPMPATGKTALRTGLDGLDIGFFARVIDRVATGLFLAGDGLEKRFSHGMGPLLKSSFPGIHAGDGGG